MPVVPVQPSPGGLLEKVINPEGRSSNHQKLEDVKTSLVQGSAWTAFQKTGQPASPDQPEGSALSVISEDINFIYDPYSNDICMRVKRVNLKMVGVISKNLPMYFCFYKGFSSAYTLAKLSKNVSH